MKAETLAFLVQVARGEIVSKCLAAFALLAGVEPSQRCGVAAPSVFPVLDLMISTHYVRVV
jgi:hypothetical protein